MLVFHDDVKMCQIPDCMGEGDTIIRDDVIYIITSKTYDADSNEVYCKVILYESEKPCKLTIGEILTVLYGKEYFESSGANTNVINTNPRLIMLMIIAATVIEDSHFKENSNTYKDNIIAQWNNKNINWRSIFDDEPPVKLDDIEKIKSVSCELFAAYKIADAIWPFTAQKSQSE